MTGRGVTAVSRLGLSPGATIDGRFRLDRLLGVGGGGEVWEAAEAVDAEAWRRIALKLLRAPEPGARRGSSPSPEPDRTFLHEARAVSQVVCEALPRIHTVGMAQAPAVPFIAMELLEGETLDERLVRGPVHWRKALAIAGQIAAALDACHAAGVVHCDLKPRNVFLERGMRRRVLVLDFGIAALGGVSPAAGRSGGGGRRRVVDETDVDGVDAPFVPEAPVATPIVGTPGYISPERLTGHLPDPRDDAFALGVVLYRMIAGSMPQRLPAGAEGTPASDSSKKGSDSVEIALNRATLEGTFAPLAQAAPATPRAVLDLVVRLLGPVEARPGKGELAKVVDETYRRPHGRPATPYAGLEAFGEQRMGYLPGRAGDVEAIVGRLRDQVALVLCGPSGTGKSSLAVAGVAARVDEEMLLDTEGWVPVVLRPSSVRGGLRLAGGEAPREKGKPAVGTVVVVDQLEEVLSLEEGPRSAFCQAFAALVTRRAAVQAGEARIGRDDVVRVVATVRDDLFGRVAALPELERLPESNLYVVRGVDPNAAREIVLGPLDESERALMAEGVDVVGDVARELERDASALPLVQFALARLWDRRAAGGRVLEARAWKEIGGIVGALGEAAQNWYEGLYPGEQKVARSLFLKLFEVEGTRNVLDHAALDPAARSLVAQLVAAGLVRRRAEEGGRTVIEPLHEALAKGWPLLARWLDEVRADRELARDAQRDARRWERNGRPADMLWGGTLLKNTAVLEAIREEPGRAFVAASLAAAERARALAEQARKRAFWVGRVVPAGVVVAMLGIALTGWWTTSREKQRADEALQRLDEALAESKKNERKATTSAEAARRAEAEAKQALNEVEEAGKREAEAKRKYKEDLDELTAQVKRAKTTKELEQIQQRIEDKGKLDAVAPVTGGSVVKPPASVVPPVPSPFDP